MLSLRLPLAAAAAACSLLAVALPGAADAGVRTAKFTATFDATLKTTWSLPRHTTPQDCYHVRWRHGTGSETWKIRSRGAGTKVTARSSNGPAVGWSTGWELGGTPVDFLAGGIIDRDSHLGEGWTPGPCGGEPGVVEKPKQDCGSRLPSYEIALSQQGDRISAMPLAAATARNEKNTYDECFLPTATGVLAGTWPKVEAKLAKSAVFGRSRTLTAKGVKTWREPKHSASGTGTLSTTTKLTWTLKLRRAR